MKETWEEWWIYNPKIKWIKKNINSLGWGCLVICIVFSLELHIFKWVPNGIKYSPDTKCQRPLLLNSNTILDRSFGVDKARVTNECYIKHYNMSCVFPEMYGVLENIFTVKLESSGQIKHHAGLTDIIYSQFINATYEDVSQNMVHKSLLPTVATHKRGIIYTYEASCLYLKHTYT